MGWEALEQWGDDVARVEPLAGGVANEVWSLRVNGRLCRPQAEGDTTRVFDRGEPPIFWASRCPVALDNSAEGDRSPKAVLEVANLHIQAHAGYGRWSGWAPLQPSVAAVSFADDPVVGAQLGLLKG